MAASVTLSRERVTQSEGAKRLGITPQAIGQWAVRPGAPAELKNGKRVLFWPDFPRWREAEIKREARGVGRPEDEAAAQKRKLIADAVLAELAVAEKEGALIALQVHEDVVEELGARLLSVIQNFPSNYLVDLERAGIEPAKGQAVLEKIAADLTGCLRASVDDFDDPES